MNQESTDSTRRPCLGPNPRPSKPIMKVPPHSWDTHFHIFGPPDRFAYDDNRKYTPPSASVEEYLALLDVLGIERGVCVQPNLHGSDNRVTLDAIARSDGRFLGIVKLDGQTSFQDAQRMNALGIRGVRFAFNPEHGGELDEALFNRVIDWSGELDWCIDLHLAPNDLVRLSETLSRTSARIIIDHMGRIDPALGLEQRPFQTLLEVARLDHIWIKLSGADRITKKGYPYSDVIPFAKRLVEEAPGRVIWGSDWPHSAYFDSERVPDDGQLLDLLRDIAPSEAAVEKILVHNPRKLFRD
jgi:predicted TIM-barrel fold metal-dependent hydrolase